MLTVCSSPRPRPPPGDDPVARKYCFRATARMLNRATGKVVGKIVAYDATPSVVTEVKAACLARLDEIPEDYECDGDVEVVFLGECPVPLGVYYTSLT